MTIFLIYLAGVIFNVLGYINVNEEMRIRDMYLMAFSWLFLFLCIIGAFFEWLNQSANKVIWRKKD